MSPTLPSLRRLLLTGLSLLLAAPALATPHALCVYDPAGKAGEFYAQIDEFALAAAGWGVDLSLRPYTDEETATRDYEAGSCDGVLATGVRLQRFNRFPSTLEAMGAVPDYDHLSDMMWTLARYPSAAARLRSGDHETVGMLSAGAVYLFLRDRTMDTVPELAGKRVATMDYDKAAPEMVKRVGAIMVPADLGSIGPQFNNGAVDLCYMSAPGYAPFELWRGLGTSGGVMRAPFAQATLQLMVRAPAFPEDFGARSRTWFAEHFADSVAVAKRADAQIPEAMWIVPSAPQQAEWDALFLEVRLRLRDELGAYDPAMLSALRKLRCARSPSRAECASPRE
ncbi:MAG: hypothetical protein JXX28_04605 [Deltaproteobacteria bacterium]|nr:hypothetical protein [Deltaproteobacteria bacterium]